MPILPTELIHLILEQVWDSLCAHAEVDYRVRPYPSTVIFVFGNFRFVCKTWNELIVSKFLPRLQWGPRSGDTEDPNDALDSSKADLRTCRLFEMQARRKDTEDDALVRWSAELEGKTYLDDIMLKLQNASDVMAFMPISVLAEQQLSTMADVLESLSPEQGARVRTLEIHLEDEEQGQPRVTGFIRGSTLGRLAAILPEVHDLRIISGGPSELAEHDDADDCDFWASLRYLTIQDMDCIIGTTPPARPISTLTRILTSSASTLRELVALSTVFGTMNRTGSSLLSVFGSANYPSLTKLHILAPPIGHESPVDSTLFAKLPALTDLALTLSDTCTPSFLLHIARTLTHLALELPRLNALWSQALITFITSRGSTLRFLYIDLPESLVNDPHEGTPRHVLKELRLLIKVCRAYDIVFATSDERTWGGDTDVGDGKMGLYAPEKEEKGVDEDMSSLGESEVEEEEDYDAEDWGVFRRKWSEEKKRSMALADVMESLRGQLKPSVNAEDVEKALAPLLLS